MSREWIIDKDAVEALSATLTEAPKKSAPARLPKREIPIPAPGTNVHARRLAPAPAAADHGEDSASLSRRAARWAVYAAAVAAILYTGYRSAFGPAVPVPSPRVIPLFAAAAAPQPAPPMAKSASDPEESFSLTPSLMVVQSEQEQTSTRTLTLRNSTSHELTFELSASDLMAEQGSAMFSPAGTLPRSMAATAYFSQRVVNVKPHQSRSVDVTFTVPEGTTA